MSVEGWGAEEAGSFRAWRMVMSRRLVFVIAVALAGACAGEEPWGLAEATVEAGAPRVIFDVAAKPLPVIPLPNDVATRLDPSEPFTGRRVNVALDAPTRTEREVRRQAALNNGFGTYMPITVSFDRKLDLDEILKRHRMNVDFSDDAVYVIDVTPGSPTYLEAVPLDLGQGNFPLTLRYFDKYFPNDTRSESSNVLLETVEEDVNGNGKLDFGEDSDFDGVLDHPNVFPKGTKPEDGLVTFWEAETNTLIVRPVMALRQETTYAVVLTRRLVGANGVPVASPFTFVNHASQNAALEPLVEALEKHGEWGLELDDVAFAWTFTTQSVTRVLEALREGLWGRGKFAWIGQEFPPGEIVLHRIRGQGSQPAFAADVGAFIDNLAPIALAIVNDPKAAAQLTSDIKNVDYLIAGQMRVPFLMEDSDGIGSKNYPSDEDEAFDVDLQTGRAKVGSRMVPFFCAIPKKAENCANRKAPKCSKRRVCNWEKCKADDKCVDECPQGFGKCRLECSQEEICRCAPYPVVVYLHGYGGMRYEALGFAGRQAAFGLATCAMDAHAHGVDLTTLEVSIDDSNKFVVGGLLETAAKALDMPGLMEVLKDARARDLNNDGVPDAAADFWTYDVFHTRDVVRQTVLENIQLVRWLRSFDGKTMSPFDMDGDGVNDLAGDFDGDGYVDLGGPDVKYFTWGQSMGGIVSPILAAVEHVFEAVAPSCGGAGLFDLAMRSTNPGVPEAVFIPLMGPFVVGQPAEDGMVEVSFLVQDMFENFPVQAIHPFMRVKLDPGDRVVLKNLVNGERDEALVDADLRFRLAVASDALVASERRVILGIAEDASNAPMPTTDTTKLGDALAFEIYDGPTEMLAERVTEFQQDVVFMGARYLAGAPLVALSTGYGLKRGTPDLRRFLGFASMLIEPGDPVGYAPHLIMDPLPIAAEERSDLVHAGANALILPSAGDTNVPINTGLALARTAGIIPVTEPDPDYHVTDEHCKGTGRMSPMCDFVGKNLTPNQVLILTNVYEGISWLKRFDVPPWNDDRDVLFDPDDVDDGKLGWPVTELIDGWWEVPVENGPPSPDLQDWGFPPLRITTPDGRNGLRIFLGYATDRHGFDTPAPHWDFDTNTYFANLVANFFYRVSVDDEPSSAAPWIMDGPCMADSTCKQFP